ncbi:hypothetical protein B0H34DRAFT_661794, partial [Crassisporium funariophilum]
LLGNLFGYMFFGILIVQIFIYQYRFPKDPTWLKGLVWFVFLLDILVTMFATISAWNLFAVGWGNPANLSPLDWPLTGLPFLSALIASCVHCFFAWRIWKLQKLWFICIPLVLARCFGPEASSQYLFLSSTGFLDNLWSSRLLRVLKNQFTWLGGSAIIDVLITLTMTYILWKAGAASAFKSTSSNINKLITVTVETGMTTAIGALVETILFVVYPNNNMHSLLYVASCLLYSNTLLATLNSRAYFGDRRVTSRPALWNDDSGSESTGANNSSTHYSSNHYATRPALPGSVQIQTTTERREDVEMFVIEVRAGRHHFIMRPC